MEAIGLFRREQRKGLNLLEGPSVPLYHLAPKQLITLGDGQQNSRITNIFESPFILVKYPSPNTRHLYGLKCKGQSSAVQNSHERLMFLINVFSNILENTKFYQLSASMLMLSWENLTYFLFVKCIEHSHSTSSTRPKVFLKKLYLCSSCLIVAAI